jgi:hypothetical protein
MIYLKKIPPYFGKKVFPPYFFHGAFAPRLTWCRRPAVDSSLLTLMAKASRVTIERRRIAEKDRN